MRCRARMTAIVIVLILAGILIGCSQESPQVTAAGGNGETARQEAPTQDLPDYDEDDTGETFLLEWVGLPEPTRTVRERVFHDYISSVAGDRIEMNFLARGAIAPSSQDVLELVRAGEITMGSVSEEGIEIVFPEISALAIPFIIPSSIVAQRILDHDSPVFKNIAENFYRGTNGEARILGAHINSFRDFYSVEPVRVPDDLVRHNVTIRVQELPMTIAVWEALGAAAIGLPAADRYMALETGLINALEGGLSSVYNIGAFNILNYATKLGYRLSANFIIVNEEWYQSLPRSLREVVNEGWIKAIWMESQVREYFNLVEAENFLADGNQFVVPTSREMAQWSAIAVPTAREFLEDMIDTSWIDFLQENVARVQAEIAEKSATIGATF